MFPLNPDVFLLFQAGAFGQIDIAGDFKPLFSSIDSSIETLRARNFSKEGQPNPIKHMQIRIAQNNTFEKWTKLTMLDQRLVNE